ncbi:hypothetical protein DENIS_4334 [Desulfonema ishimotonii]|uniref:ABC transporter substrate-binding protein n=1 Tax=Desulfonema ishimotonii TaxID=45657 RepID=A0A401G291_9BACT|nr:ABC transporter substrate binding protein [Desulfonema ishimotonii]GBC63340.1 hypothetical protein DENIS_4334 [Desulfonema ishimotonii]
MKGSVFQKKPFVLFAILVLGLGCWAPTALAQKKKVLVVFSYEADYLWDIELKDGIDGVLSDSCEIRYFYMNTKKHLEESKQRGEEAYALWQEYQPDGVIAMDDNAQQDFVIPFLRDKVRTPVIFGGVNEEPETYGYPASNVSGILDRFHIGESIAMAQQLVPEIETVGFVMKESPTARYLKIQIDRESSDYPAKVVAVKMPKTKKEALEMTGTLKGQCDLLYVAVMTGLKDENGNPMSEREAVRMVADAFGKATITNLEGNVKNGTLCAVVKTGQEQGSVAAEMLLKAMNGTPFSELPIVRNRHGKRVLNATVMKKLGIRPDPMVLRGAKLVKTEQ